MATDMKRFTLTVTPEIKEKLDELKKSEFYDRPHADMYRSVIDAGLLAIKSGLKQQSETFENNPTECE